MALELEGLGSANLLGRMGESVPFLDCPPFHLHGAVFDAFFEL